MRGLMLRLAGFLACMGLTCIAIGHAQMPMTQAAYTPSPSGGSSCTTTMDATSNSVAIGFGVTKLRNAYAGKVLKLSTAGTTGTYADVGFNATNGCSIDITSFYTAIFTGSTVGTALTVTAVSSGTINNGDTIVSNGGTGLTTGTMISSGGPCSSGGVPCVLTINNSQNVSSESMGSNPKCLVTATTTTGCPIQTFYDQSGNACNPTQATGANQASLFTNQQNSLPGISFSGSSETYTCTLASGVTTVSPAWVANEDSSALAQLFGVGPSSGLGSWGGFSSGSVEVLAKYDGTTGSTASLGSDTRTVWEQYGGTVTNTLTRIILNRVANFDETTAVTIPSETTFTLGSFPGGGSRFWAGTFGEIVIFAPAISGCTAGSGDCNTISLAQKTNWATP